MSEMTISNIQVLQGEIFIDDRGQISSLNNFRFDEIRRMYVIHHPNLDVVRGWHAHQNEQKWFYCIKGSFTLALVKIDDWKQPSSDLDAEIYSLDSKESCIVHVPKGYANCLKASSPDSIMLVLSDKILEEALKDSWRYDKDLWVDWSKY